MKNTRTNTKRLALRFISGALLILLLVSLIGCTGADENEELRGNGYSSNEAREVLQQNQGTIPPTHTETNPDLFTTRYCPDLQGLVITNFTNNGSVVDVVIPRVINNVPVVAIGGGSNVGGGPFAGTGIRSVELHTGISHLIDYAFAEPRGGATSGLRGICLPPSVIFVGNRVFLRFEADELVLPESLVYLASVALTYANVSNVVILGGNLINYETGRDALFHLISLHCSTEHLKEAKPFVKIL